MRIGQETVGTRARPVMRPVLRHQPGVGHTAYHHVGDIDQETIGTQALPVMRPVLRHQVGIGGVADSAWNLAATGAIGLAAYHGYKRNHSIGWALAWSLAAAFAPIITTAVVLAQGVGKKG